MRSMRQTNTTFMERMGWRLIKEPDSLWSRVVRNKYCNGRCDWDMISKKANASNLWNGIIKARDPLMQGLRSAVGDGT